MNSPSYGFIKGHTELSIDKNPLKISKTKQISINGNESSKHNENIKSYMLSPDSFKRAKDEDKTTRTECISK